MYHGIKEKVRELRSAGKMYSEIRQLLDLKIPKSTLSSWCQGIVLDDRAKIRIAEKVRKTLVAARVKAWRAIAKKREKYLDSIYKKNYNIGHKLHNDQVAKIALAMLYLGEGSKTHRGSLMFGNSEPATTALFLKLLRQVYVIDEGKLRFTVQCRADQNISLLESYWSRVTNIPKSQCYKAQVDLRTKGKPSKKKDYKGVCRIDYFSSYTDSDLKIVAELINRHYKI